MGKIILQFTFQVIVTCAMFTLVLWGLNTVFDKDSTLSPEMLFQGVVFSIIYVSYTRWRNKRKADK